MSAANNTNHSSTSPTSSASASASWKDRLRGWDAHSTVESEFRVYTVQGALFSVVTVLLILYLVVTEFWFNFQVVTTERVHVNATSASGLELEFDLSFYDVPCAHLSIDANDPTGQVQSLHLDRTHHVWKHRVRFPKSGANAGQRILMGSKMKLEFGSTLKSMDDLKEELPQLFTTSNGTQEEGLPSTVKEGNDEQEEDPDCGSCYGAATEENECCNSCDDIERAYKRKGWILRDYTSIPLCAHKALLKMERDEGCNVHGIVALDTGGGNLHLTPSKSAVSSSLDSAASKAAHSGATPNMILELLLGQMTQQWNVSHVIHKLRFGPDYPEAINQLDDQQRIVADTYGMYQYYVQVVPTTYKFLNGTVIQTNQYSVTEHLRHVEIGIGGSRGVPGVFFFYEVSPLHVEIVESYRKGYVAFFTSVCAVVGGVVTVMGMLDQWMFRSQRGPGGLGR
ncbi:hypothetical protein ACA910_018958 [Epithemia clementina (nom. ined.)]